MFKVGDKVKIQNFSYLPPAARRELERKVESPIFNILEVQGNLLVLGFNDPAISERNQEHCSVFMENRVVITPNHTVTYASNPIETGDFALVVPPLSISKSHLEGQYVKVLCKHLHIDVIRDVAKVEFYQYHPNGSSLGGQVKKGHGYYLRTDKLSKASRS